MSEEKPGAAPDQRAVWDRRFQRVPKRFYQETPVSGKTRDVGEFFLSHGAKDVLDVGCAVGRWTMYFSRLGMRCAGVDISQMAIDMARGWAREQSRDIDYRVATASKLPFPDASFDAVVASAVIDHVPFLEGKKAMSEMHRVLRPGGLLFLSLDGEESDPAPHETLPDGSWVYTEDDLQGVVWRFYTDDEARDLMAGFHELLWENTPSGDRWIYASKK